LYKSLKENIVYKEEITILWGWKWVICSTH